MILYDIVTRNRDTCKFCALQKIIFLFIPFILLFLLLSLREKKGKDIFSFSIPQKVLKDKIERNSPKSLIEYCQTKSRYLQILRFAENYSSCYFSYYLYEKRKQKEYFHFRFSRNQIKRTLMSLFLLEKIDRIYYLGTFIFAREEERRKRNSHVSFRMRKFRERRSTGRAVFPYKKIALSLGNIKFYAPIDCAPLLRQYRY